MGLQTYLAIRSINLVIVILLVVVLTYLMFQGAFYNIKVESIKQEAQAVVQQCVIRGSCQTEEDKKRIYDQIFNELYRAYGLDKPWYEQLWFIMRDILSFNFGNSQVIRADNGDRTVSVIIAERVPRSVLLLGTTVLITTILGLILGLYSANRPQSLLDKTTIVFGLTGYAFAAWWVGLVLQFIFAYQLRILPALGIYDPLVPKNTWFDVFIDVGRHMILPVTSLVVVSFGGWALVVRNLLIGTLAEDFIVAARAKGVPERKILFGHALKTSTPPIITIIALSVAGVFGGAIITETVFQWEGLGLLIWEAILNLDLPIIIAFFYISTILIVIANLVADILYGIFDPRVKT